MKTGHGLWVTGYRQFIELKSVIQATDFMLKSFCRQIFNGKRQEYPASARRQP
jgi:hypothetical protein